MASRYAALWCALSASLSGAAGQVSFEPMGTLPGFRESQGLHISDDGSLVVGTVDIGREAVIWTRAGGLVGIGPGGAWDATADGSRIIGNDPSTVGPYEWTPGGGVKPIDGLDIAWGISSDGSIISGLAWDPELEDFRPAFIRGGAAYHIDPGPDAYLAPQGMSADGLTFAGTISTPSGGRVWSWSESGGLKVLPPPAVGTGPGVMGVSGDGATIIGSVRIADASAPAAWNEDGDLELIARGFPFYRSAQARGASFDGSVIVGGSNTVQPTDDAFVWMRNTGALRLSDVLDRHGVLPDGWQLHIAYAVSADGTTITGYGYNPLGRREGWIATIPAPSAASTALALGLTVVRRRRRGEARRTMAHDPHAHRSRARPACSARPRPGPAQHSVHLHR
ncbi:MAG: hypothetical protein ACF8R7_08765 [Phycisphaerales bacterium JB039]